MQFIADGDEFRALFVKLIGCGNRFFVDIIETGNQRFNAFRQFTDSFAGIIIQNADQFGEVVDVSTQFLLNTGGLQGCFFGSLLQFNRLGPQGFRHGFGRAGAAVFGIDQLVQIGPEKSGFVFEIRSPVNIGHNHPDNCQRQRDTGQKCTKFVWHHQKQIGPAKKLADIN